MVKSVAQTAFQPHTFQSFPIHFLGEEAISLSFFLGRVHCHISVLDQCFHIISIVRIDTNTNTPRYVKFVVLDTKRIGNFLANLFSHFGHISVVGEIAQDDGEFIISKPEDVVAFPQAVL